MTKEKIELPPKLIPVFSGAARYRGAHGGRGSGKTRSFALMTAVRAYMFAEANVSGVILCGREFMNSLEDSSMEEIKQAIRETPWLDAYFDIGERYIRTRNRRVHYVFAGLRHNLDSIKSKARILIAWIDEAEGVSEVALQKLLPTVRAEGSECWITWNPELDGSPVDIRFRKNPSYDAKIVELSYGDNPWFPSVLEGERLRDQCTLDPETYAWIWDGAYRENSVAQIFANKYRISEFDPQPEWDGPYFGLDFGFSQDPCAGVKLWINNRKLYVEREAGGIEIENDDLAALMIKELPDIEKHVVVADNARPELISHLKKPDPNRMRPNLPKIEPCAKGKGSVEDGISFMKSFDEIVVHARCKETIKEFRMYSYKVDRLSGDVLTDIVDKWNHYMDAIRYAIEKVRKKSSFFAG
jgi:phage terminase large subunit